MAKHRLGDDVYIIHKGAEWVDDSVVVSEKVIGPVTITGVIEETTVDSYEVSYYTDPSWGTIGEHRVVRTEAEALEKIEKGMT